MSSEFKINTETISFLDKQTGLIKKGWYIYAPVALAVFIIVFLRDYRPGKIYQQLIIMLFSMGTIYFFTFVVSPLKRISVLNHVVEHICFNEKTIKFSTYPVLWKKAIIVEMDYEHFKLKPGAHKKKAELYGYSDSYRLIDALHNKEYLISASMFAESMQVNNLLTEKISLYE